MTKISNLNFQDKQKEEIDQTAATSLSSGTASASLANSLQHSELEPDDELALELPPPMKPLQDSVAATLPTATAIVNEEPLATCPPNLKNLDESASVDLSEIEQIVKEKMVS